MSWGHKSGHHSPPTETLAMIAINQQPATNQNFLSQLNWFIDPVNGDDNNDGATPATALETWAELNKRWGNWNLLTPPPTTTIYGDLPITTVTILNDLPPTDPINFEVNLQMGGLLYIRGNTPTVSRAGTLSANATVLSRTNVPNPGGTPWSISDPGITAADVNNLITFTSGPASGGYTWGAKVTSPGNLRLSNIANVVLFPNANFTGNAVSNPPLAGNTYNVLALTEATLGYINVGYEGNPPHSEDDITFPFFGFFGANDPGGVYFDLLHFTVTPGGQGRWSALGPSDVGFIFNRCKIDNSIDWLQGQFIGVNSGYFGLGDLVRGGLEFTAPTFIVLTAGLVNGFPGIGIFSPSVGVRGGKVVLDGDILLQNTHAITYAGGNTQFAAVGVFDTQPSAFGVPELSAGVSAVNGGSPIQAGFLGGGSGLYGNGNAGFGVAIINFSSMDTNGAGNTVITGVGGDFSVAFETAKLWTFDLTAGTYAGPTAATWPNLIAKKSLSNPFRQGIIT